MNAMSTSPTRAGSEIGWVMKYVRWSGVRSFTPPASVCWKTKGSEASAFTMKPDVNKVIDNKRDWPRQVQTLHRATVSSAIVCPPAFGRTAAVAVFRLSRWTRRWGSYASPPSPARRVDPTAHTRGSVAATLHPACVGRQYVFGERLASGKFGNNTDACHATHGQCGADWAGRSLRGGRLRGRRRCLLRFLQAGDGASTTRRRT